MLINDPSSAFLIILSQLDYDQGKLRRREIRGHIPRLRPPCFLTKAGTGASVGMKVKNLQFFIENSAEVV